MSSDKILDQAEIDALIHGVDSGKVSTEPAPAPDEARSYDFSREMRIVRGRMPTLEMINERFARLFRVSLYNLLRRSPEIAVQPIQVRKFSEYVHTLHVPTSLNLVKINPIATWSDEEMQIACGSVAENDTVITVLGEQLLQVERAIREFVGRKADVFKDEGCATRARTANRR